MSDIELKMALVKTTASSFHRFISKMNTKMEQLLHHMEHGQIDETCPLEKVAVESTQEFLKNGHAQAMRELGETAENLAERAGVAYLSEYDARVIAGELADMLERYNGEREKLAGMQAKLHEAAKRQAELN